MYRITNQAIRPFLLLVTLLLISSVALADSPFKLRFNSDVRGRTEWDKRSFVEDVEKQVNQGIRTRIGFRGGFEFLRLSTQLQIPNTQYFLSHQNYLDPYQIYAELRTTRSRSDFNMSLKGGRFELAFGSERILGRRDWTEDGYVYDGMYAKLYGPKAGFHMFTARPVVRFAEQDGRFDTYTHKRYTGAWFDVNDGFMTLFYINEQHEDLSSNGDLYSYGFKRNTLGISLLPNHRNGAGVDLEFAYQFGKINHTDYKIEAGLFSLFVWNAVAGNRVGVGLDFMPGQDPEVDDAFTTYVPSAYSPHEFFGLMDYFIGSQDQGIVDLYAAAEFSPSRFSSLSMKAHRFLREHEFLGATSEEGKDLGTELDAELNFTYKQNEVGAGVGYFIPTDHWRGEDAVESYFAYLTYRVRFNANIIGGYNALID